MPGGSRCWPRDSADLALDRSRATPRRPDVVIADYQLGGGRYGTDVVLSAREMFSEAIPSVILTGETRPAFARTAVLHGIEIIHKPVTPWPLAATSGFRMSKNRSRDCTG